MRARLDLDLWYPRDPEIRPEPLIINARCAVLLFQAQVNAGKILDGMLSVLELARSEYMLINIYQEQPDLEKISKKLLLWQPATILQLSMDIPAVIVLDNVVRTFSPKHLLGNPQDKPQAYKDLLNLRKILQDGTTNRYT